MYVWPLFHPSLSARETVAVHGVSPTRSALSQYVYIQRMYECTYGTLPRRALLFTFVVHHEGSTRERRGSRTSTRDCKRGTMRRDGPMAKWRLRNVHCTDAELHMCDGHANEKTPAARIWQMPDPLYTLWLSLLGF